MHEVDITFDEYKEDFEKLSKLADSLSLQDFDFEELKHQLHQLEKIDTNQSNGTYKNISKKIL